jgi:thiamine-phosphate pyrophosphorylase
VQPSQPRYGAPAERADYPQRVQPTSATARTVLSDRGEERRRQLSGARLYLCTDTRREQGDLEAFLHAVYAGGVDVVQIRDRSVDTEEELAALRLLAGVAGEHGRLFAVNDRADLAVLVGADALHVGQRDLTPAEARGLLGPDVVVGRSTHTAAQAADALADPDVDYFCTGPVWATPTKPGRAGTGLGFVREAAALVAGSTTPKPWFAIGGVDADRLADVRAAGAERVVVVRAVTDADRPRDAAGVLRAGLPG